MSMINKTMIVKRLAKEVMCLCEHFKRYGTSRWSTGSKRGVMRWVPWLSPWILLRGSKVLSTLHVMRLLSQVMISQLGRIRYGHENKPVLVISWGNELVSLGSGLATLKPVLPYTKEKKWKCYMMCAWKHNAWVFKKVYPYYYYL